MSDSLIEFVFPGRGVRGAVAQIESGIEEMLGARPYPADVRRLLGEAIAAAPLLMSHSKLSGRINLQFQGKGALQLLVTQIDHHLRVRGMAKSAADAAGGFEALMGGGLLALMLEPDKGGQNYQAMVEIRGGSLAGALEGYFAQSEQLPTRVCLAASRGRLAGLLLQRLPARSGHDDDANWEHLSTLFATLSPEELSGTDGLDVLRRLFHEEALRVTEPRPVTLTCSCSRASISGLLLSLGKDELAPVLEEHGKVEVTCEFCGRVHTYDPADVAALFTGATHVPGPTTRH